MNPHNPPYGRGGPNMFGNVPNMYGMGGNFVETPFYVEDYNPQASPVATPSPGDHNHAHFYTPRRPATRAHVRSPPAAAYDNIRRPPSASPRYTSEGHYATAEVGGYPMRKHAFDSPTPRVFPDRRHSNVFVRNHVQEPVTPEDSGPEVINTPDGVYFIRPDRPRRRSFGHEKFPNMRNEQRADFGFPQQSYYTPERFNTDPGYKSSAPPRFTYENYHEYFDPRANTRPMYHGPSQPYPPHPHAHHTHPHAHPHSHPQTPTYAQGPPPPPPMFTSPRHHASPQYREPSRSKSMREPRVRPTYRTVHADDEIEVEEVEDDDVHPLNQQHHFQQQQQQAKETFETGTKHQRRKSAAAAANPQSPRNTQSRKATKKDAILHRIPESYSLRYWDPNETPILLLGSVFDAKSLGKWIYDWTCYVDGPSSSNSEIAAEMWIRLIRFSTNFRRAEDCIGQVRDKEKHKLLQMFISSGERIMESLRVLLKTCEEPMLRASRVKGERLGDDAGVQFVQTMFGHTRYLGSTEAFMEKLKTYNTRFVANCLEIIDHPTA